MRNRYDELSAKNLIKTYGNKTVVKGINISVRRGEIVGLLGPNGAGKTTSFYMITGMVKPSSGDVFLDEKKVTLEVEKDAREWLAENGYDSKLGARPMQRLIQDKIKKNLAESILFGDLSSSGGVVTVKLEDGDIKVLFSEHQAGKEKEKQTK